MNKIQQDKIKNKKMFHVGRPNIPDKSKVLKNFENVLDSQWLTNMGPYSTQLEERIADFLSVKHCICVCNATAGLELLYRALELEGEVIIPAFTFVATAHSLKWVGLEPVFCDVSLNDHLIDPNKIEELITPRTSAILGVPLWGQPCDYDSLSRIANKYGLHLIFDSAHAFACKKGQRFIGGFGDAEVFSFHATKVFSTGEGGAITTNNDSLAKKLRAMRNFGFSDCGEVNYLGINAKLSEFQAAYGLAALDELDQIVQKNRRMYEHYKSSFADLSSISFLEYNNKNESNYQYVVARVNPKERDAVLRMYHKNNILVRRYFWPGVHNIVPYKQHVRSNVNDLLNAEKLCSEVIVFPNGMQMRADDVCRIANLYREFLSE